MKRILNLVNDLNICFKLQNNQTVPNQDSSNFNCSLTVNNRINVDMNLTRGLTNHISLEKCSIISQIDLSMLCKSKTQETFDIVCEPIHKDPYYLYKTVSFWTFVFLVALGSIGYNVANSISDAICFDVLGKALKAKRNESDYYTA